MTLGALDEKVKAAVEAMRWVLGFHDTGGELVEHHWRVVRARADDVLFEYRGDAHTTEVTDDH